MPDLINALTKVPDFRRLQGKRHQLWLILIIVITSFMSGYTSYRGIASFAKRHQSTIGDVFKINNLKVPSIATFRRVMMSINTDKLREIFNQWACSSLTNEQLNIVPIDGKSLKNTLLNTHEQSQNFVSIVSAYNIKTNQVVCLEKLENKKESEIKVARKLIKILAGQKVLFTGDSLHCQKETVTQIIEQSNDYLMAVKRNQPSLHKKIIEISQTTEPNSRDISLEKTRDRKTQRIVKVFSLIDGIHKDWKELKSLITVERSGTRKGQPYFQQAYYLSSLKESAKYFNSAIRKHWSIENKLHYVKDVVLLEDSSKITDINASINLSILSTIAINLLRKLPIISITNAIREVAHDWAKLFPLLI